MSLRLEHAVALSGDHDKLTLLNPFDDLKAVDVQALSIPANFVTLQHVLVLVFFFRTRMPS